MAGPDIKNIGALPTPIPGKETLAPEPDTKNLDALLDSLNGSAERFQTLWFSFLGLTLYLAIAALATPHRNLLLGEPQTLPIVNIKVELLPFYVIAPLLYLVFHFYLLMMLALLARTAAEFDKQLRTTLATEAEHERYRARVENALFLQLLVGMKGERTGVNAFLLGVIALITIVLAPLATLILMQMMFLPYHHLRITWWHRAVVVADLVLIVLMTYRCFFPRGVRKAPLVLGTLSRKLRWTTAMAFCVLLAVILAPLVDWLSFRQGRWAGEPSASSWQEWAQWMEGAPPPMPVAVPDYAATANGVVFGLFPDRLKLPNEPIVGEKLVEETTKESNARQGDFIPTRQFTISDLEAADLNGADLRGVDLSDKNVSGANLEYVRLDGARLAGATLQGTDLSRARLQGASLGAVLENGEIVKITQLQRADLSGAELQGAVLTHAQLQGSKLNDARLAHADLAFAQLQGAELRSARLESAEVAEAELQGADLRYARLQGADLSNTQLQGADLSDAQLQGAYLEDAQLGGAYLSQAGLQGADLAEAELQGTDLTHAELQGANLARADMTDSTFDQTLVFRTAIADASLSMSAVRSAPADQVTFGEFRKIEPLTASDVEAWRNDATLFASGRSKDDIVKRFDRLKPDFQDDPDEVKWSGMREASLAIDPDGAGHRRRLAKLLGDLACEPAYASYVAHGLVRQFQVGPYGLEYRLAALGDQLATFRARLEAGREKPKTCPGVAGFTEEDWLRLDAIAPAKDTAPADH